jgi:hypothetical protein
MELKGRAPLFLSFPGGNSNKGGLAISVQNTVITLIVKNTLTNPGLVLA